MRLSGTSSGFRSSGLAALLLTQRPRATCAALGAGVPARAEAPRAGHGLLDARLQATVDQLALTALDALLERADDRTALDRDAGDSRILADRAARSTSQLLAAAEREHQLDGAVRPWRHVGRQGNCDGAGVHLSPPVGNGIYIFYHHYL